MITIPWRAWYGDEDLTLDFPEAWDVRAYWPNDAPELNAAEIEAAFDRPIGAPPIEELARRMVAQGKRTVAIAVDDISRPTPAARLMPPLMRRLEAGGIDLDDVRVVLAVGMHRQMVRADILKKLGTAAVDRLDVYNNYPHTNLTDFGVSKRGTPIKVCRFFGEADLKIGVGSIAPHGGPGYGGGGKIVVPGVASYETVSEMHRPGRLRGGLLNVDHNELRADIEDMARRVGLDWIVNVVITARRGVAGVFVGDMVAAHRAGVALANKVYATPMPPEPVDVAICNAYPKDTDFHQAGLALNAIASAKVGPLPRRVVKEGGTVVIITASPEGRGFHLLYSPGMVYARGEADWRNSSSPMVYFSPNVTPQDARSPLLFRVWDDLVDYLADRHINPSVAVFPCGSNQVAAGRIV